MKNVELKDAAELAYRMGSIPKPDLVDLMNLFIGWGGDCAEETMAGSHWLPVEA